MFEVNSSTPFVHHIDLPECQTLVMEGVQRSHALTVAQALRDMYTKGQSDKEHEVNVVLREAGLDYPLGIRGVKDLIQQRNGEHARALEAERELAYWREGSI